MLSGLCDIATPKLVASRGSPVDERKRLYRQVIAELKALEHDIANIRDFTAAERVRAELRALMELLQ